MAVVLVFAASACGSREALFPGVAPVPDGSRYEVAALMPLCGCMTIAVNEESSAAEIIVIATFHGTEVGRLMLAAGKAQSVAFDWGGATRGDRYEMRASVVSYKDGKRGGAAAPSVTSLLRVEDVAEMSCRTRRCDFGGLHMGEAFREPAYSGSR